MITSTPQVLRASIRRVTPDAIQNVKDALRLWQPESRALFELVLGVLDERAANAVRDLLLDTCMHKLVSNRVKTNVHLGRITPKAPGCFFEAVGGTFPPNLTLIWGTYTLVDPWINAVSSVWATDLLKNGITLDLRSVSPERHEAIAAIRATLDEVVVPFHFGVLYPDIGAVPDIVVTKAPPVEAPPAPQTVFTSILHQCGIFPIPEDSEEEDEANDEIRSACGDH